MSRLHAIAGPGPNGDFCDRRAMNNESRIQLHLGAGEARLLLEIPYNARGDATGTRPAFIDLCRMRLARELKT
jgi:hypothetical protein